MKTWPKKKKSIYEIVFLLALILAMKTAIKILDPIRFIMDAHIDVIFFFFLKYVLTSPFLYQAIILIALISAYLLSLVLPILTNMAALRSPNNFAANLIFLHTGDLGHSGMSSTLKSVSLNGKWIIAIHHIPAQ